MGLAIDHQQLVAALNYAENIAFVEMFREASSDDAGFEAFYAWVWAWAIKVGKLFGHSGEDIK